MAGSYLRVEQTQPCEGSCYFCSPHCRCQQTAHRCLPYNVCMYKNNHRRHTGACLIMSVCTKIIIDVTQEPAL